MMRAVTPASAADFARAIIMPNLVPPVVTGKDAQGYRDRILAAIPAENDFTPLMTLYLTETTDPEDVVQAAQNGLIHAVKLYPAGATTNSDSGVTDFEKVRPVLERMAQIGLPLCVHGEVTTPEIDIFDREAVFIETILNPLRKKVPGLRVIMEHVTTKDGVDYIAGEQDMAGSITTHHLILNRNDLLVGGIRPHYYCLPIVKREIHRQALLNAAISGSEKYFLGTDSAPHPTDAKESACGCAGCFTAPNTMACLAHVFENAGALDKLEGFVSEFGADFYGLARNDGQMVLQKSEQPVEAPRMVRDVQVFDPGFDVHWYVDRS